MCIFRKCDESVVETKEYPSLIERARQQGLKVINPHAGDARRTLMTTIKCAACGRIRIDERRV